jgi:DNA-binding transcriptional LysR family regulator
VSDHIKTLETEIGCRLFDRMGRTLIPTREEEIRLSHVVLRRRFSLVNHEKRPLPIS